MSPWGPREYSLGSGATAVTVARRSLFATDKRVFLELRSDWPFGQQQLSLPREMITSVANIVREIELMQLARRSMGK